MCEPTPRFGSNSMTASRLSVTLSNITVLSVDTYNAIRTGGTEDERNGWGESGGRVPRYHPIIKFQKASDFNLPWSVRLWNVDIYLSYDRTKL